MTFGLMFNTDMEKNFETIAELIDACKMKNSLIWMVIRDLEKDYKHSRNLNNTVEKLEEIFETLDALASVVAK